MARSKSSAVKARWETLLDEIESSHKSRVRSLYEDACKLLAVSLDTEFQNSHNVIGERFDKLDKYASMILVHADASFLFDMLKVEDKQSVWEADLNAVYDRTVEYVAERRRSEIASRNPKKDTDAGAAGSGTGEKEGARRDDDGGKLIAKLRKENKALLEENAALRAENQALKAELQVYTPPSYSPELSVA